MVFNNEAFVTLREFGSTVYEPLEGKYTNFNQVIFYES